ncbi:baeRF11 domain-containing protein [Leucobacter sp. M11]|uniref:baeRF11 domain-containing protein n=1 Tax=Leucobacter sp. M11 TaxID=2993565 RepID=UPI002D7F6F9E|nr:hypothetical protein [Leucobacter sp. M11]MEB4616303.1 hypothetical protein [Leucobacter sp. M11]
MYTDIPQREEIERLAAAENEHSVTLVLRSSPVTSEAERLRIEFNNLASEAVSALRARTEGKANGEAADAVEALLRELHEDQEFWRFQSHSLVVFVTPEQIVSYRLPNALDSEWFAGKHFRIVPLLRTITFPHEASVLALSQKATRLIAIGPDHPGTEIPVPDLPTDILDTFNVSDPGTQSHQRRLHGPEGQSERLRAYARSIDRAVAPVVRATRRPLIIAATQPLLGEFRAQSTMPKLLSEAIEGNPDERSAAELDAAARDILDRHYEETLAEWTEQFQNRQASGRAVTDLSDVARAAVAGAIQTLYLDLAAHPEGTLDREFGTINTEPEPCESLIDRIVAQVLAHGGRVRVLRAGQVPGGGLQGAEVRFSV